MLTNIRAWGNSQGIYIPKKILKEASIGLNDPVELSVVDGGIMISRSSDIDSKAKAWESVKSIRSLHAKSNAKISDDYKKEMEEYLDEKYGRQDS